MVTGQKTPYSSPGILAATVSSPPSSLLIQQILFSFWEKLCGSHGMNPTQPSPFSLLSEFSSVCLSPAAGLSVSLPCSLPLSPSVCHPASLALSPHSLLGLTTLIIVSL